MFIIFFIHNDAGNVPCKPLILMNYALDMICWAFASLIIVLRIMAIWDRSILVSSIAFSVWSTAFGLSIRSIWPKIGAVYNPEFDVCLIVNSHSGMVSVVAIPVADTILLSMMFVGLLRREHGCKTGLWQVLYRQCIIWMIVAAIAEIPPMVFLILNLNAAWNEMFPQVAGAILSICASRMYRSLCKQGTLTEYSPDPPYPPGLPLPNSYRRDAHGVPSTLHFRSTGTLEDHHDMTIEPFVFVPTAEEMIQVDLNDHDAVSNTTLAVPPKAKSRNVPAGYRLSWHRPVDASMPVLEFE